MISSCGLLGVQGLEPDEKLGIGSLVVAGGLAGMAFWLPVYPADVIKSKLQVDDYHRPAYKGTIDCAIKAGTLAPDWATNRSAFALSGHTE